jgi:hypothetical protein
VNSPATDVIAYLATNGVGTVGATSGWSLNLSKEPASPDTTVTLYDTGGFGADYDVNLYKPTIQIRVRGNGYSSVYAKAQAIETLLIAPKGFTQNSFYVGAWNPGGFESLGYDENDRAIIVININLMREA